MDEAYYRTMLFDFYGELLTDKQKEYFDLHYNSARAYGTSYAGRRRRCAGLKTGPVWWHVLPTSAGSPIGWRKSWPR